MKSLKLAVMAIFTLAAVSNLNAQDEDNPWAVSIGMNAFDARLGSAFGDHLKDYYGTRDWDVFPSLSRISAEKYLDDGFTLQFAGSFNRITSSYYSSAPETSTSDKLIYYSIDANLKYDLDALVGKIFGGTTQYFNPFIYAGGGYASLDGEREGVFSYGFGFNIWLSETLGFVYQSGTKQQFANRIPTHYQHSLSLAIKFGGKDTDGDGIYDKKDACPEVAGLPEFNGCPDSDGDGIKDSEDACPNAAGLPVLNGCPDADEDGIADKDDMCPNAKGTKANNGCPDTDGDGIIDKNDKCATVAGPSANGGCPWPDTDGDGVLDKDDNCKDKVGPASNDGCPLPIITPKAEKELESFAKTILFDSSTSKFKKGVSTTLDEIAKIMKEYPKATFLVEGHADITGSDKFNDELSVKRANAVKAYLEKAGIDASRLSTKGFGSTVPAGDNKSRSGRAKNRRVEIKVTNN